MVLFESGAASSFRTINFPIIVEIKSSAAGSTSSSAMVCGYLPFAILYATLKDASCALVNVCKKFENKTDCLFISDNLRAKKSLGFPGKLLWFVVK